MLRMFERDMPVLFLGSAFVIIGDLVLVAALLCRQLDAMLLWFGLFSLLRFVREGPNFSNEMNLYPMPFTQLTVSHKTDQQDLPKSCIRDLGMLKTVGRQGEPV